MLLFTVIIGFLVDLFCPDVFSHLCENGVVGSVNKLSIYHVEQVREGALAYQNIRFFGLINIFSHYYNFIIYFLLQSIDLLLI